MQHPDVIELRAGHASVGVAPRIGGSLTHFRWEFGDACVDWLRPATFEDLAAGCADRLASYPLVPYSNRIREGRFTFGGQAIQLSLNRPPLPHAIHGHGWQEAWDVAEVESDRIALTYEHSKGDWPFPYRVRQEITLDERELSMILSVENLGRSTMPAGLGWHPYFPRTAEATLHARVAAMWATDAEIMPTTIVAPDTRLADGQGLPLDSVALDNVFTGWDREATIVWPEWNARLTLLAEAPIDFLVVHAPRHARYFCVEPVSHCTDAFNLAAEGRMGTGTLALPPGGRLRTGVRMRPARR